MFVYWTFKFIRQYCLSSFDLSFVYLSIHVYLSSSCHFFAIVNLPTETSREVLSIAFSLAKSAICVDISNVSCSAKNELRILQNLNCETVLQWRFCCYKLKERAREARVAERRIIAEVSVSSCKGTGKCFKKRGRLFYQELRQKWCNLCQRMKSIWDSFCHL